MSAQRRSGRKRAVNTRINDLPDSSPTQRSRPSAKRRKANPLPRSRPSRHHQNPDGGDEDDEDLVNNDTEEEEDEADPQDLTLDEENQEMTDLMIRHLEIAKDPVAVAEAYKSEIWDEYGKDIQAFAKISGQKWTYFVTEVKIVIGRQPEDVKDGEEDKVHIDLGPNKMISRFHSELFYDPASEAWHISVHGRNGVRVNEKQIRRGESSRVNSGDIIGIAGTQMLFQLAGQPVNIAPFFLDRIRNAQESSENGMSSALSRKVKYDPEMGSDIVFADRNGHVRSPTPPAARLPEGQPKTPQSSPTKRDLPSGKKRSPYKRGMMMESTEQIDYSLDSSKDIKPGCSYASMITWAILDSPDEALSLHGIYEWIKKHYAYYRLVPSGWQNSIRHNLSLNSNFHKIPRRPDEPGKGMKWTFVPETREATIAAAMRNASKAGGRTSSAPGSPNATTNQNSFTFSGPNGNLKTSPSQQTPPLSSYPAQPETATPSHAASAPSMAGYAPTTGQLPVLSDETSPIPKRYNTNGHLTISGSSPVLTSGAYDSTSLPMHTPAPRPYNLTVPQPNTVKLPTSHMTPTTPAPFWRLPSTNGLGSTPARWPDSSPAKAGSGSGLPLSSSPPPSGVGSGADSPTRRGTFDSSAPQSQRENGSKEGSGEAKDAVSADTNSIVKVETSASWQRPAPPAAPSTSSGPAPASNSMSSFGSANADQEGGGIDLLKGFTKISTFHQPPQQHRRSSANQPASGRMHHADPMAPSAPGTMSMAPRSSSSTQAH